jgi:hypothetical protein
MTIPPYMDRFEAGRLRFDIRMARRGIVPLDLYRLLGRLVDATERRAAARALQRLEDAGRIERLVGILGVKTTHVRLIEGAK